MTSRFASLTEQDIEDEDSETQKGWWRCQRSLFADDMKEKKLREPEQKKELAQTLTTFYVTAKQERKDSFNV